MKKFIDQIKKVAQWAGLSYNCEQEIMELHKEFFKKQPYRHSKIKCDNIVQQLMINKDIELPKLDLLEQAYINAKLGNDYFL
jgi:hypothetical protein